jgi:hypothetical protein
MTAGALRVAMLTYSVRPRGGVVHAIAVAEALAARGHAVDLFAVGPPGAAFFRAPGVPAHVVPNTTEDRDFDARIAATIAAYRDGLRAILRDGGYDVVHAQDCISANAHRPPRRRLPLAVAHRVPDPLDRRARPRAVRLAAVDRAGARRVRRRGRPRRQRRRHRALPAAP